MGSVTFAPDVALLPAPDSRRLRLQLTAALLTAVAAALVLAFGPSPADAAAHLYRTFLVRHGYLVWDNLWFGGHYPLASYSLLYYFPAVVVGNLPLVFAATLLSTILFADIAYQEWGPVAVWPTRIFAVFAAAPLFTGAYSYGLGLAAMLGALRAAQARQTWLTVLLAALTLGLSPLAFAFLVLVLAAVAVGRRVVDKKSVIIGAALVALTGAQLAVLAIFPSSGVYPFHLADLLSVLGVCALGALLSRSLPRGAPFVAFFVLWGLGSIVAYAVPNTIGDNWTRLRGFVLPVMLVVALLTHFRPRVLAVCALAAALAYNLVPYLQQIQYRTDVRPETATFWSPPLGYLRAHLSPNYRVEVVPTTEHWETYWLPRAGIPIARGWYRQLDIVENPSLYRHSLTGLGYRMWLRAMGVKYVLLPATTLDPVGGTAEARLLRSGAAGLREVYRGSGGTVYALPHATPLLTGRARAYIARIGHTAVTGWVAEPGRYFLRERYTPYFKVRPGGCASATQSHMTWLTVTRAGRFTLKVPHSPTAILSAAVSDHHACNMSFGGRPG
jgi:hypothetical protein